MAVTATERLPLHVMLDALAEWETRPSRRRQGELLEAFSELVASYGSDGAFLDVDAPPLPRLRLGLGALAGGAEGVGPDVDEFPLRSRAGRRRLGSLWLVGGGERRTSGARAIEVAIDAAWSRAAARDVLAQMDALDTASRAIAGIRSLPEVLQLIVEQVRELARARYAALGIVGPGGAIEQFYTSGISAEQRARIGAVPHGRGLLGLLIREGRSIRIADIRRDRRSVGFPPNHPVMRTFLGVPVTVKGRAIGNLYLTEKLDGEPFSEDDQSVVETFALHAGIAIENARLHEDVQRLVIVEERDRIGRDLHDSIIQSLYAVGLSLEDVPELMDEVPTEAKARVERAIDSLHAAIGEMRDFIFGLRPELLDRAGLSAGLRALAEEFRLNTLLDVRLDLDGIGPNEIPPDRSIEVLQIAREALSNVARHAQASAVRVALTREGGAVRLSIEDNGTGFKPGAPRTPRHHGLANMSERAVALGATLFVDSRKGEGTRIDLRVPIGTPDGATEEEERA